MTTQPDPSQSEPRSAAAHTMANEAGDDGYFDPDTGLFVMTQGFLERRGNCCSRKCRHC
ncbi:MAG: hypothetical protein ACI88C_003029, partial [Acidimicrobiales bacterium]